MPPDVAARIFEPFFTTKDTGKGTGLGLSMVYGFIKQSGGYIGVESEVGKGTAVKLYLPCAATTVQPAEDTVLLQAASIRPSGAVILAVDDNPDVRTTAVKNLKALGYQVLEADCANRALEELDSGTKIDLLFTDIIMPGGINGNELAKLARIKRPGLKVLYTSGFPGTQLGGTVEIEADAPLLNKPYRRNDLAKLIAEVLAAA
jgi:CheY-like chemotaxis protein